MIVRETGVANVNPLKSLNLNESLNNSGKKFFLQFLRKQLKNKVSEAQNKIATADRSSKDEPKVPSREQKKRMDLFPIEALCFYLEDGQ
jgi:hypothetical protein